MSQINEALRAQRNVFAILPSPFGSRRAPELEVVAQETFWPLYHGTNNYQNFADEWERV